jgi:hypothetical protein
MNLQPPCAIVFLLGCLGALLPEIVKLYAARTGLKRRTFHYSYFIISIVYSAVGGVFAIYLSNQTAISAIYLGATWPVILGNMIRHKGRKEPIELQARRAANEKPGMEFLMTPKRCPFHDLLELIRNQADLLF